MLLCIAIRVVLYCVLSCCIVLYSTAPNVMYVCLFVGLSVCLFVCLSVFLFVGLFVCV